MMTVAGVAALEAGAEVRSETVTETIESENGSLWIGNGKESVSGNVSVRFTADSASLSCT